MRKSNNIKHVTLLVFALLICVVTNAQNTITGKVVDENNEPLIGVNVIIKNSTIGTISNYEGIYNLSAKPSDTLVFNFIGYETGEYPVGNNSTINVTLNPDIEQLDEVVVIGFGSVRKKDISSSITTVSGDDITKTQQGNFTSALQGKAAGVQVFSTDGSPGSQPTVIIRGATSINGDPNPMYVVDGIPIGNNPNQINSDDIETVTILKDASATAIYGTQAANGVILITTKKGKMGENNFSVSASMGIQQLRKPNVAGAREYMLVHNEKAYNADQSLGRFQRFSQEQIDTTKTTDYWNEAMRAFAPKYNVNIGFDGGSKKVRYSGNVGYFKQESQLDVGYWDKITARFNTEYLFNDNIKIGQNFNPRVETWQNTPEIWGLISMDPTTPIYRPESEQVGLNRYSIYQRSFNNDTWNPMAEIERAKETNNNLQVGMQTNSYLNIRFLDDFVFNTQVGLDFSSHMDDQYNPEYVIDPGKELNEVSSVSRQVNNYYGFVWNNTLSYVKTFNAIHNLNLMVGYVAEKGKTKDVWGYATSIPNDNPSLRYLSAAEKDPEATGTDYINTALLSSLARVMYNYNEKYYLNMSVRRDGSYKFPEDNKYGIFPALSVAWSAHNEDFIKNLGFIDQMKLRAGWGQVGNQKPLESHVYLFTLDKAPYVYGDGAQTKVGRYNSQFANKDIRWETVEDYSGGIDLAVLNNSVTLTADIFSKRTKDMLMEKSYSFYSGYPNFGAIVWSNIGSIKSNGFEIAAGYSKHQGEFTFNASVNITRIKTKAMKLANGVDYDDAYWGPPITKTRVGELVGQFYGYKTDGLFQNQTEINSHTNEHGNLLQPNAKPGDIRFQDLNKDGVLDDNDQTFLGSGQPDFTAGINFDAAYKGFDLSLSMYSSIGADIFNAGIWEWQWGANNANVFAGSYDLAWHGEGTSNKVPLLDANDLNENFEKISDIYLENGNYLKVRYIQLGYTFPNFGKINSFRIYANIENPFVFTNYTGLDPELYGWVTTQNIDWGDNYPNPRVFSLGLNLKF